MVRKRETPGGNNNGNSGRMGRGISSKPKPPRQPRGRPPIYDSEYHPSVAYKLVSRHGLSYEMLSDAFGVTPGVIVQWQDEHPEFLNSIKRGSDDLSAGKVKAALSARALGYSHPEEKVFCNTAGEVTRVTVTKHYPPDVVAIIYMLGNWTRRWDNGEWMNVNRHELTGRDGKPIQTQDAITQELLRKMLENAKPEALINLRSSLEHIACANTDPC